MGLEDRIKEIREYANLNQRDFSMRIDVGQSTLAQFETGGRKAKDIHINRICQEFNVNERWLRTGEGNMFRETHSELVNRIMKEQGQINDEIRDLIEMLIEMMIDMTPEEIKLTKDFAKMIASRTSHNEKRHDHNGQH